MATYLDDILARHRAAAATDTRSTGELAELARSLPPTRGFADALRNGDRLAVISEIKRRSPSAGDIRAGASSVEQACRYQAAGADALSVLTDEKFFGGTLDDLRDVTAHFRTSPPARPCLRKDFFVHPIQVLQAREAGASAILIIVRALTDDEISALHQAATAAGLDALFEIHNEDELRRAVQHRAKIIGVNNRDLAVFKTDIGLSERLIPQFPKNVVAVSESGFSTATDASRARAAGAHALLVGESLMKSSDPARLVAEFQAV
jgi:indole-3-glycerol phosphate synthase